MPSGGSGSLSGSSPAERQSRYDRIHNENMPTNEFVAKMLDGFSYVVDILSFGTGSSGDFMRDIADGLRVGGVKGYAKSFVVMMNELAANEGQKSLVEDIGLEGVESALVEGMANGGDCSGLLVDMTDHPEAIGQLLEEIESEMTAFLEELLQDAAEELD